MAYVIFILKVLFTFGSILAVIMYNYPCMTIEIITGLAVIVALFREQILSFYIKPKLVISNAEKPNHYSEISALKKDPLGKILESSKIVVMGLEVKNEGIGSAKNVQLFFTGIKSNAVENFSRYKSIPFCQRWANRERIVKSLPSKTSVTFAIGFIEFTKPEIFHFDLSESPLALANIKWTENGSAFFTFEAITISDNSKTSRALIRIEFPGEYTTDLKLEIS